jgi:hypothetical protein
MNDVRKRITTDKTKPGYWRVTLNNPPINAIDDRMYDEVFDLIEKIEAEPSLKVVTFESANPDFFIAHYSTAEPRSRFGIPPWIDAATRLARSDVLSIAVIRGRVRAEAAASSPWLATSDLPAAKELSSASRKSELALSRVAAPFSAYRFWWGAHGRSRSSSARTISMQRRPNVMDGSTAPFRRGSLMVSSTTLYDAFCRSICSR